jgi:hypothetical protein
MYTVLARSLARGGPYGLINEPGVPSPPRFGFGFPLLLAPVVKLFPYTMEGLSAVSLAATLLNVSLLFWGWPLLSPATSRWLGLATTSLYALSPETIGCTRMVMSEPAFTSLVLIGILLTERCCERRRAGGWAPAALGVVLAAAVFTRTIGVVLGAAAGLRLVSAKRAHLVPLIAFSGVAAVALLLIVTPIEARHLVPTEYLNYLQTGVVGSIPHTRSEGFVHQVLRVSGAYIGQDIRRTIVAIGTGERERAVMARLGLPWDPAIAGILISAVVAIGAYRAVQDRVLCRVALLFETLYTAVLLVWAWNLARYLYPIQPFLSFQFLVGVGWLWTRATRQVRDPELRARQSGRAIAVTWVVLIALAIWKSLVIGDSRQFTRDLTAGASWLAANSAEESIVMARFPESVFLYSGRKTVDAEPASTPESFAELLDRRRIDYLLVAPALRWSADGQIDYDEFDRAMLAMASTLAARSRLDLVYESDLRQKVLVFRVRHAPGSPEP